MTFLGPVGVADGHRGDHRHGHQVPDVPDREVREVDDELRGRRQPMPEAREDVREDGDHPDEEDGGHEDGGRHDARGVDHRPLDLALQLAGLLQVGGEPHEDGVEDTADLTRLDHAAVELGEDPAVLANSLREGGAGLDVFLDPADHLAERLGIALRAQDLQALDDRQPGVDHGRELTREDHDVSRLDGRADAGEGDLVVETLPFLLDASGVRLDALSPEADDDRVAARGLHLAAQRFAPGRNALPVIDRHGG